MEHAFQEFKSSEGTALSREERSQLKLKDLEQTSMGSQRMDILERENRDLREELERLSLKLKSTEDNAQYYHKRTLEDGQIIADLKAKVNAQ